MKPTYHCWEAFFTWLHHHSLICAVEAVLHSGKSLRFLVPEERDSVGHLRVSFLVLSVCALFMVWLQDRIYMKIHEIWHQNSPVRFRKRVCCHPRACSLPSLCFKGIEKIQNFLVATHIAISGS